MRRLRDNAHPFDDVSVDETAIEQAIFWAASGIRPDMAFAALGMSWQAMREPGWYDVQLALSCAWRSMRRPALRRAA